MTSSSALNCGISGFFSACLHTSGCSLVGQGQQVFIISWRNPLAHHADWDSDTYAAEIIKAMDITAKAAGVEKVALTGICSGGILSSLAVAHLAATHRLDRLAAFSLFVPVLHPDYRERVRARGQSGGAGSGHEKR